VARRDLHLPAGREERADLTRRDAAVLELLGDRAALTVADQRVAADGDQHRGPSRHTGAVTTPTSAASAASAAWKHPSGARAMPAPIWPTPGSRCAMPVLLTGARPCSTTRRRSMPVGVPTNPRAGIAYSASLASVIPYIARVYSTASAGVPPTNRTIAGAPAIAKPPMPAVSVIALSPRSGLASAGP